MKTAEEIAAVIGASRAEPTPQTWAGLRTYLVGAITAYCDQDGVEIGHWIAEHDGVHVVQIDTPDGIDRIRINLNDGPVWDGSPEDERPGSHFHDVWDDHDNPEEMSVLAEAELEGQSAMTGERNWDEQDWPDAPTPGWPASEFVPCHENGGHLLTARHTRDECEVES